VVQDGYRRWRGQTGTMGGGCDICLKNEVYQDVEIYSKECASGMGDQPRRIRVSLCQSAWAAGHREASTAKRENSARRRGGTTTVGIKAPSTIVHNVRGDTTGTNHDICHLLKIKIIKNFRPGGLPWRMQASAKQAPGGEGGAAPGGRRARRRGSGTPSRRRRRPRRCGPWRGGGRGSPAAPRGRAAGPSGEGREGSGASAGSRNIDPCFAVGVI